MTHKEKNVYIAALKKERVESDGCFYCSEGKVLPAILGFERYWCKQVLGMELVYSSRRFVFKYSDPRESDVPVSQLSRSKTVTNCEINEALARCVILCRSCADPRRTRKDDKCQKATSISD